MDVSLFRQQIEWMKNNFNIVTMEQVIESVRGVQPAGTGTVTDF
jgi:hypothetical protein